MALSMEQTMFFKGSAVALVTPMLDNGSIDFDSLVKLIDWHLASNTQAIVVNGTTGEAATLSQDEQAKTLQCVVEQVNKRIPVIAGTGSYSTQKAIELTQVAEQLGADLALIVTPFYNKPTQKGLIKHYQAIADASKLPFLLYNVPSRTAVDLLPETVCALSKVKNIVGIKEATGQIARVKEIKKGADASFLVFSGDDVTTLEFVQAGGDGVISVTANVIPKLVQNLCQAANNGETRKAQDLNERCLALNKALFLEANPIPIKWLLNHLGKIGPGIRLPLTPLSQQHHQSLIKAYQAVGDSVCAE